MLLKRVETSCGSGLMTCMILKLPQGSSCGWIGWPRETLATANLCATECGNWWIDYGPGYRIYYAMAGKACALLLCGGDKRKQAVDIDRAVEYWKDYKRRIGKP